MESPTQDEKLMAGFSHVSILLRGVGIVLPIVMWVTQREKSKFVEAHALQALGWQLLDVVAGMLAGVVCMVVFVSISFTHSGGPPSNAFPLGMLVPFGVFGVVAVVMIVMVIVGLVGAYNAFQGRAYVYPIIGRYMQRFQR